MSLRDQLLQKGLASKKDVRRVEQDLERERRALEGNQRRKSLIEAEQAEKVAREAAAATAARRAARTAYEAAREQSERALQIRNLVASNAVRIGGPVRFFHRLPGSGRIGAVQIGLPLANQLRSGELAIAALPDASGFEVRVVRRAAAERLAELAPHLVVFWNRDPTGILAPDQQLLERTWESALGPHRATELDRRRYSSAST